MIARMTTNAKGLACWLNFFFGFHWS